MFGYVVAHLYNVVVQYLSKVSMKIERGMIKEELETKVQNNIIKKSKKKEEEEQRGDKGTCLK